MILLSIMFQNLWAVFFSVEALMLSFYMLFVCVNIDEKSKKAYWKTGWLIFFFGLVTLVLGIVFNTLFSNFSVDVNNGINESYRFYYILLEYSYYFLYFVYILVSNVIHINTKNFLERIGLANRIV